MNAINWKKLLLPNIPYLLFVYLFDKVGQAVRLAPGADLSGKVLSLADGFSAAFTNPLPSLARMDLLIGIVGAVLIRLIVYVKGKNAKKYRKGIEYGSARWGTAEDIKPYTDPVFQNNVLLTQTERLTMNSRPKQPKYARNKNILVIGGSGSGKTRFFVKPNLMQMHSSYVVTDPKGTVLVECGRLLHRGGYRIKVLNTINFKKSMKYNPFAYLRSEKDILKLVNTLIANTKGDGEKAGEDFWVKSERLFYCALIGYIWYEAPEEEKNFTTLLEMINASEAREDDPEFQSPVDLMFERLEGKDPEHFAVRQYKKFLLSAGKTRSSILISCGARLEETTGKAKTRLRFEEQEKPIPGGKAHSNPLSHPAQEAGIFVHNKIHSVEKDNSGVEGAHKSEELAERGARYGTRKLKQGYRSHKLKPYREAAKAEQAAFKANVNFQYHKALQENPQLTSNPFSRFMQKQKIKRQYAKTVKKSGSATAKAAAGASQTAAKKAAAFAGRHPAGVIIAIAALLLFIMVSVGLSSCGAMFSGSMNSVLGTSYTSEDSDLVATEQSYAAMENELQQEIDNIESTHSGYDEYRYDLDTIGHNPHELASYLTALLQSYTPQSAQAELKRLFGLQYTLTLTEEIEIRTTTDEEGNEEEYEYRILNVKLTNKPIASLAEELLNPQQFEMFKVYLQTQGNKPLIFGGGSPDGSPSEDLSGVEFVNGTRPGNPELMELAKQQVGNVGGYPYWSWYGFNSRVEWCACFVSWCYNQAGKSEPRFAGCEWQGVPWFQSRGQWGARGYENIAPGDAIFFDWDLDGVADHVGLVLGRDGSRVYTVEGNSGDACKIKSYDLNYQCIKGYGLMNW